MYSLIFAMDRREEEDQELPPGFSTSSNTRISPENNASSNQGNKFSSSGTVSNARPNIRFKFLRDDNINLNSTPVDEQPKKTKSTRSDKGNSAIMTSKSELSKKTKTSDGCQKTKEANVANSSDKGTDSGGTDYNETAADMLSFNGENGQVYTLSPPPQAPNLTQLRTSQVDAHSVICVKKGLISFIMEAGPYDVGRIITQANNIFAFIQAMNADYGSFYYGIRAYIRHCLEWYIAKQELKRCKALEKVVAQFDQLLHRSNEMKKEVLVVEGDVEKAKGYMAPLEARLQDMKEMVERLEVELEERRNDLRNLEARKAEKTKEIATLDVELKASAGDVEKKRRLIRDNTAAKRLQENVWRRQEMNY